MDYQHHALNWATEWLAQPKRILIGGEWTPGSRGKTIPTVNPYNGQVLTNFVDANGIDVDHAVNAAKKSFVDPAWRGMTRRSRSQALQNIGALIRKHRSELATLESLDNGKTFGESYNDDLPESADVFDYYAGWLDKFYSETCPVEQGFLNYTKREPLGVCALVVPWNFPLLLACWKLAPALAMGNTVVVKPSPFTPLTLIRLAELINEAVVLPPGVFNLVTGGNECGEALSSHQGVAKISFTGSTAVGKRIVQAAGASNLKSVTLELGGKSPNIIFDDIKDLDAVVERSFVAMFCHKGEKCSEPTRFLIHDKIYDAFVKRLLPKVEAVVCGDPFKTSTTQGPQCHEAHLNKILDYIAIGQREGAKLLAGGTREVSGENKQGFFVRPTVFGDCTSSMRVAREEIFGPVLVLIRFKTDEEAIHIANDTEYGLAAGLYTSDITRAHRVADALEAGMVFINHYGCYDFASPFGGVKQSGWGREMAIHSLDAYTRLKSIWVRYS